MSFIISDDFPGITDSIKNIKNFIYEHGAIQIMVHLEAIDIQGITSQIATGIEYTGSRFMDKQNSIHTLACLFNSRILHKIFSENKNYCLR